MVTQKFGFAILGPICCMKAVMNWM